MGLTTSTSRGEHVRGASSLVIILVCLSVVRSSPSANGESQIEPAGSSNGLIQFEDLPLNEANLSTEANPKPPGAMEGEELIDGTGGTAPVLSTRLSATMTTPTPSSASSSTVYPPDFDVNKRDSYENTELHLAAMRGDEAAVRQLVQLGADLNARNHFDSTPLHKAAEACSWNCSKSDCLNVINFLVDQGADVDAQDLRRNIFLFYLFGGGTTITPPQFHQVAEKYGHLFNARDYMQNSVLHYALRNAKKVETSTLKLLHDKGADFTEVNRYGRTVLEAAVRGHQSEAVLSQLIQFGVDYKRLNNYGGSVLHDAAATGDPDMVAFFIRKGGLDVNGRDKSGHTPLHIVGRKWSKLRNTSDPLKVIQVLLDNGADMSIKDGEGETMFDKVGKGEGEDFKNLV